ncbi:MAG: hypothetical protein KTQ49_05475 [Candidatus Omnitrophica bacterium]|nr:hypothetical protein [Candidatus Omnitrophota bacterium]
MMIALAVRRRANRGQSGVETAFALLIALAFLVFIWEGIYFGYNWVAMQFVLSRALQDVRTDKSEGLILGNIQRNAEDFNLTEGMHAPVIQFGGFSWYEGKENRQMVRISLARDIRFGFFMSKVFPGSSGMITVRVSGYAETPPSIG